MQPLDLILNIEKKLIAQRFREGGGGLFKFISLTVF